MLCYSVRLKDYVQVSAKATKLFANDGSTLVIPSCCMLRKHNWTNARIGEELGMDADEVLRLKQITGLAEAFKDVDFSKSWI